MSYVFYENIREEGFCIILQKWKWNRNRSTRELLLFIIIRKINVFKKEDNTHIELKSVLNDKQGQWLTKIDEDLYIGIDETELKCL